MTFALAPFSLLYGTLVRTRLRLYRAGFLKSQSVGAPVISVGNITAGGTGKTPLVEWVARSLAREGRRVCVLTRGYGRADERRRVVVSDGERLLAEVRESGDEPRLLAERLLGVAAVVCDADRVNAARWARASLGAEVFVLDDGFQHLRIARDLDIVTIDATAPWGGGEMLPRGRLREPPGGLARAGCVVITRSDLAEDLESLRAEIERLSVGRAAVVASRVRTLRLGSLDVSSAKLEGRDVPRPVAAFCAIGNPRAFFAHLRADGFELCHTRAFPDHHAYTTSDMETIALEAERHGARALLTTAKDAVKLRADGFSLPCYVVEIGLEFDEEDRLLGMIREAAGRHF
jgi:tetraacyldisaccharide 4'-kinase